MAKSIGELSVFVDESGSFDSSLEPSRFYIVTLLCHDQAEVVKPFVDELESQLGYLGYPDTCIHAGPLLRREENFRVVEIETRRKLFGRMLAFTRKLPVSYHSLVVDKQEHTTPESISEELKRQLVDFIGRPENPIARARKIKLYYDDGQDQVKDLLTTSFVRLPVEFKTGVLPDKYRLFQAADLICTIELLAVKHEKDMPLNKSEEFFFGKWRDLKKNYLAPLRRLSMAIPSGFEG